MLPHQNMGREFFRKIRKMNWVLSESTTGSLLYGSSRIMSELIHANTYIINAQGRVLGVGYTNAEDDTSTYIDELGFEKNSGGEQSQSAEAHRNKGQPAR